MAARGISDGPQCSVIADGNHRFLRSAAIYGANSSGKSNFVSSLRCMRSTVLNSVRLNPGEAISSYDPFLLNAVGKSQPTFFEIVFRTGKGTAYRYGFTYDRESIHKEWLFSMLATREHYLFIRNNDGIGINEALFPEGRDKETQVNDNRLFLSLCAQLGGEKSQDVIDWFENGFVVVSGLVSRRYEDYTKELFRSKDPLSEDLLDFFKKIQLGFVDISTHEEKILFPRSISNYTDRVVVKVDSIHNKYDRNGNVVDTVNFDFDSRESTGTNKIFNLSGIIFNALRKGATLAVDEMDAAMHPLISQQVISLFSNPDYSPYNAQLIFNTHDTHLLSAKILRRDQIWFTEKDSKEETDLYNMMDIVFPDGSKPRNDADYEKNYINGRYGAVPFLKVE